MVKLPKTATKKGGHSEALVKAAFDTATRDRIETLYQRVYDSYSAGGAYMPAQAGDFMFIHKGHHGVIEVKSTAKPTSLPKKNFGDGQLARLQRVQLAGATSQVWVHHTTTDVWRHVPVSFLISSFYECGSSWVLSQFPETDPQLLVNALFM